MNTLNALVGIDFWLPIGKRAKLQFISGLNFCRFNESNSKGEIAETGINIENYYKAFGFGWGNDVQFKFKADKRCSFIIGLTFSTGLGKETRSQEPSSKDTNTTFIPIVNTKNIDVFNSIPYIGLSVNF